MYNFVIVVVNLLYVVLYVIIYRQMFIIINSVILFIMEKIIWDFPP